MTRLFSQGLIAALIGATVVLAACDEASVFRYVAPNFRNVIRGFITTNSDATTMEIAPGSSAGHSTTFDNTQTQGLVADAGGTLYTAAATNIRVMCNVVNRDGEAFNDSTPPEKDRALSVAEVTDPGGSALITKNGALAVANRSGTDAVVFVSSAAAGSPAAAFTLTAANVGDFANDVAYDETHDILYAALPNGNIAAYDAFVANFGTQTTPDRTFKPSNALPGVTRLSGILYSITRDALIVTDIGNPLALTDGSVYVFYAPDLIANAASPVPAITLRGPNTRLGNPLDVAENQGGLLVAEGSNGGGAYLYFKDAFVTGKNPASPPALARAAAAGSPVSVANLLGESLLVGTDASDTSSPLLVAYISRDADLVNGDDTDLATPTFSFTATPSHFPVNLTFDGLGDGYLTFDDTAGGVGYSVIRRMATRDGNTQNPDNDRIVTGASTTLISPKGIDTVTSQGLVIVADQDLLGAGQIAVFSACASGNVTPMFTYPLASAPWELDYDEGSDTLYVALADGTVLAIDTFLADLITPPAVPTPTRVIIPSDGVVQVSTELHGLVYLAGKDQLIVSDIGPTSTAAVDGALYVIDGASAADGLTVPTATIAGASTDLTDPNDLAVDPSNYWIFVADSVTGDLLRFDADLLPVVPGPDGVLDIDGDVAPTKTLAGVAGLRSVVLVDPNIPQP